MNPQASSTEAPSPPFLRADGLTVRRGERVLFAELGFTIPQGGVLLVRGSNGAGKSTLLLTLAGIIRPDAGRFAYRDHGGDVPMAPRTHLLSYQHGLKARLTVHENLSFWRDMLGATGLDIATALLRVGLGGLETLETGYLSSGQVRRLALARLLVSERKLWLLDEPTATLDAAGETLLGEMIDRHREGGGMAVVATHHDLMLKQRDLVQTLVLGQ